jgi:hypothetical protein
VSDNVTEAVAKLWDSSENYPYPSPFTLYLDLIGWNTTRYGKHMAGGCECGLYEAHLVGEALIEFARDPVSVGKFINDLMMGNQLTIDFGGLDSDG